MQVNDNDKTKCDLTSFSLILPSFKFGSVSKTGSGALITLLEPGTSVISVFVFLKGFTNLYKFNLLHDLWIFIHSKPGCYDINQLTSSSHTPHYQMWCCCFLHFHHHLNRKIHHLSYQTWVPVYMTCQVDPQPEALCSVLLPILKVYLLQLREQAHVAAACLLG